MPKAFTGDVLKRKNAVLQLLKMQGPLKVSDICRLLSITPMQAYYVLALLTAEGKVTREKAKGYFIYKAVSE